MSIVESKISATKAPKTINKSKKKWSNILISRDNLKNLFDKMEYTDIAFMCNDMKIIKAHKFILSNYSEYFRNMFKFNDNYQNIDVSSDILSFIIYFIYTNKIKVVYSYMTKEAFSQVSMTEIKENIKLYGQILAKTSEFMLENLSDIIIKELVSITNLDASFTPIIFNIGLGLMNIEVIRSIRMHLTKNMILSVDNLVHSKLINEVLVDSKIMPLLYVGAIVEYNHNNKWRIYQIKSLNPLMAYRKGYNKRHFYPIDIEKIQPIGTTRTAFFGANGDDSDDSDSDNY